MRRAKSSWAIGGVVPVLRRAHCPPHPPCRAPSPRGEGRLTAVSWKAQRPSFSVRRRWREAPDEAGKIIVGDWRRGADQTQPRSILPMKTHDKIFARRTGGFIYIENNSQPGLIRSLDQRATRPALSQLYRELRGAYRKPASIVRPNYNIALRVDPNEFRVTVVQHLVRLWRVLNVQLPEEKESCENTASTPATSSPGSRSPLAGWPCPASPSSPGRRTSPSFWAFP